MTFAVKPKICRGEVTQAPSEPGKNRVQRRKGGFFNNEKGELMREMRIDFREKMGRQYRIANVPFAAGGTPAFLCCAAPFHLFTFPPFHFSTFTPFNL